MKAGMNMSNTIFTYQAEGKDNMTTTTFVSTGRRRGGAGVLTPALVIFGLIPLLMSAGVAQAGTATLGAVLHRVEKKTPALKAAYANVDVFKAKRSIVRSSFLGEIDAFAHDLHFNDNRLTRPISPPIDFSKMTFDDNQFGYGFSARLPIDLNGHLRNNFHALTHQTKAAQADADNVRLSLLDKTAALYRGIEEIVGRRVALQKQAEALRGHIKVAEAAITVGRIAPVEKLRLVAELKGVEGRLAGLNGTEAGLRARLAALLDTTAFTDSVPEVTAEPEEFRVVSDSINNRPDIVAAHELENAARSSVRAAWANYLPQFVAAADWQENQGYNGMGQHDGTWQVTIQARLPIWNGGRRRAEIGQAKAQRRAAQYLIIAKEKQALAEVIAARGSWTAAKAQYEAAQSAVAAADEVARIQTDRFDQGRLSAADLVDAEAALAGARSELTASLVRWWRADDSLRLAIGMPPAEYSQYDGNEQ
ncbi:MAG: TolC family protein [Candidatus Zixiibacteriota bacterium]|nr:MAG: TolC family protein [candidate division Zixibacteria bacterium]